MDPCVGIGPIQNGFELEARFWLLGSLLRKSAIRNSHTPGSARRVLPLTPQLREARLRLADGGVEGATGHERGLLLDAGGEQVAP